MFLLKALVTADDILSGSDKGDIGEAETYRRGLGVSFLTEVTWRSGVTTTSACSPTLSDASTIASFPSGIKMLVPSVDFTTTSSLVSMTTSPRTCVGGIAVSGCDSAGVDCSTRQIQASASQDLRLRSDRDSMRDRTVSATEAIGSIVAA